MSTTRHEAAIPMRLEPTRVAPDAKAVGRYLPQMRVFPP